MTARTALPANPFPAPERALPALARLDEYQIEQVLAQSSFAVVYRAHDTALNLQVAIKEYLPDALALRGSEVQVLPRSKAQAERFELGRKAFVEEAQVLARCDHPSLVHVTRILQQHGTVYRVMRHCPGPTLLAQRRDSAEAPAAATVRAWLEALLGALQTLHDAGCVHGAVAPGNIVLEASGRPVLLDFEAVRTALISDRTQSMMVALEPCFAPIEQREPSGMMPLGPWTDLYSLAATLHFCISGHLPSPPAHDGSAAAFDPLEPLWQRRGARIDGDAARLAAAIDACLVEWPQHRPQSVAAFRVLLGEGGTHALGAAAPAAVTRAPAPKATATPAVTRRPDTEAAGPPSSLVRATTTAAATADDRIGAQLIADLDQTFARIAAGAQDETTPASAAAGPEAASVSFTVPPLLQSAATAVPERIEPQLATPSSAQPSLPAPDDLWAASPPAIDDSLEPPSSAADSATEPAPSFMAAPKPRSLRVAGALAALAFVGIVFALAEWGPVVGDGAAPTPGSATMATPGGTDRAPAAGATEAVPFAVTPNGPVSAAAPADTAPAPRPSIVPQAPHDAVAPPGLPATAAGPAQSSAALKPPAARPDEPPPESPKEPPKEPPAKAAAQRPAKVTAAPKAKAPPAPASPREVCGNRTQFSLYQCMQTQCAASKWSAHAQCVRLRNSDRVD